MGSVPMEPLRSGSLSLHFWPIAIIVSTVILRTPLSLWKPFPVRVCRAMGMALPFGRLSEVRSQVDFFALGDGGTVPAFASVAFR